MIRKLFCLVLIVLCDPTTTAAEEKPYRPSRLSDGHVDMQGTWIIRMSADHLPATIDSWLGDSIGWWDGDTLVVETANFSASSELRQHGHGMLLLSPQAKATERFTIASHDELHYVFTISDPSYYTQAWTGENIFRRTSERIYEYACHEGNYSLTNALQSARAIEASRVND